MLNMIRRLLFLPTPPSDRAYLMHLNRRTYKMAVDIQKLAAAVARNTRAVDALIAAHSDPAAQAAVDAQADALDVESAKAEAAVVPAA